MIFGHPESAGSKTQGRRKDGSVFLRPEGNSKKKVAWRDTVAHFAGLHYDGPLLDEALFLELIFVRVRPSTHYLKDGSLSAAGKRCPIPDTSPDLTKLTRAVEDAIHGIILRNDARITDQRTKRRWGGRECVVLRLSGLPDD